MTEQMVAFRSFANRLKTPVNKRQTKNARTQKVLSDTTVFTEYGCRGANYDLTDGLEFSWHAENTEYTVLGTE